MIGTCASLMMENHALRVKGRVHPSQPVQGAGGGGGERTLASPCRVLEEEEGERAP
jgi:hypothetical protein